MCRGRAEERSCRPGNARGELSGFFRAAGVGTGGDDAGEDGDDDTHVELSGDGLNHGDGAGGITEWGDVSVAQRGHGGETEIEHFLAEIAGGEGDFVGESKGGGVGDGEDAVTLGEGVDKHEVGDDGPEDGIGAAQFRIEDVFEDFDRTDDADESGEAEGSDAQLEIPGGEPGEGLGDGAEGGDGPEECHREGEAGTIPGGLHGGEDGAQEEEFSSDGLGAGGGEFRGEEVNDADEDGDLQEAPLKFSTFKGLTFNGGAFAVHPETRKRCEEETVLRENPRVQTSRSSARLASAMMSS